MIDIHNHIIYDFDDGPETLEKSLEMLQIAADQGITDVFATSHFNELIRPEMEHDYFKKLQILRSRVEQAGIRIKLHSGGEMMYHHYIPDTVKTSRVGTLGQKGLYVLMEFPMFLMPTGAEEAIFKLSMENFLPIIAHPERYTSVMESPEKALKFIKYGALLQVNCGSVLGDFGKTVQNAAMWLIERELVHFLGSDAHAPKGRSFKMKAAADYLQGQVEDCYIEKLVRGNAEAIITNDPLDKVEYDEEVAAPKGLLGRFRQKFRL